MKAPVYVGDTISDYAAAKEAKIPFIYAKYGFGDLEEYNCAAECFEELPKILATCQ